MGSKGILIHLDFNKVFQRECRYPDDYEWFSPFDHLSNSKVKCLLGQTTQYSRRKRDVDCFNPDEYEKVQNITACPCTPSDYTCDFCFERVGSICSKIRDCVPPNIDAPCVDYYNVSKGYRLVVGDKCNVSAPDSVNWLPTRVPCGNPVTHDGTTHSLSGGIIALIVLIVLAAVFGILGTIVYLYRKNAFGNLGAYQMPSPMKRKGGLHLEEESTALDDDLLEAKEADELDDNAIKETLSASDNSYPKPAAPTNLL
jgi:hypothetical protein